MQAVRPLVLRADGEVDDVEDDAEAAGDDEQYTDDGRQASRVRVDNRRSLVGLSDVHWLNPASSCYDHVLLLRLHLDDLFLCFYIAMDTEHHPTPYDNDINCIALHCIALHSIA